MQDELRPDHSGGTDKKRVRVGTWLDREPRQVRVYRPEPDQVQEPAQDGCSLDTSLDPHTVAAGDGHDPSMN